MSSKVQAWRTPVIAPSAETLMPGPDPDQGTDDRAELLPLGLVELGLLQHADLAADRLVHGQEVDHPHRAPFGLVHGLQHERVVPVATRRRAHVDRGCEEPPAVVRRSEERGEARTRVEPREATPVDRSAAAHDGRRLQVPDQRVVLDPRHASKRRRSGTVVR